MQPMRPRTLNIQVNEPQGRFLSLQSKFRGFVGGFGSGKTYIGCIGIAQHAMMFPGIPQAYFAPTYAQIRDIFYPTMEEVGDKFELVTRVRTGVNEVELLFEGKIVSRIICRSMERPHTIIGFKVGHALVDELDVMSTDKALVAWRKIIARLRWPKALNGVDVTTTPEGFKTTYNLFVLSVMKNPELAKNYGLVQASTLDNAANLPDGYIDSLMEAYPAELISAYLNGQFVNLTAGTVYRSYNRVQHQSTEQVRGTEPLYIGMDFNIGNMAATVYVIRENGWHAVDEFHDLLDTPDMIQHIRARYERNPITVYPDATGSNREAVDASKSDISLLRQAKFVVRAHSKNPSVRGRILAVNKRFERGLLWINSNRCPTVARCLEQQSYNGQGEPEKSSGFDHQNDATTYPIAYEFPIIAPLHNASLSGV